MERYVWEGSRSQHSLKELSDKMSSVDACPETVTKYAEAVTHLHNKGYNNYISAILIQLFQDLFISWCVLQVKMRPWSIRTRRRLYHY